VQITNYEFSFVQATKEKINSVPVKTLVATFTSRETGVWNFHYINLSEFSQQATANVHRERKLLQRQARSYFNIIRRKTRLKIKATLGLQEASGLTDFHLNCLSYYIYGPGSGKMAIFRLGSATKCKENIFRNSPCQGGFYIV